MPEPVTTLYHSLCVAQGEAATAYQGLHGLRSGIDLTSRDGRTNPDTLLAWRKRRAAIRASLWRAMMALRETEVH